MNTRRNDTLFSQNLAVIRNKRGFSQVELGKMKPSIEIAMKNAEALEVSLDYFVSSSDAV